MSTREAGAVAHPMHAGDEIDEVGIDGNLGYLVAQQGEETEDEHPVIGKELGDIAALRLIFRCLLMLDFRQIRHGRTPRLWQAPERPGWHKV